MKMPIPTETPNAAEGLLAAVDKAIMMLAAYGCNDTTFLLPVRQRLLDDEQSADEVVRAEERLPAKPQDHQIEENLIRANSPQIEPQEHHTRGTAVNGESACDLLKRLGDNGMLWATEFCKTAEKLGYSAMDVDWVVVWFANAIEYSNDVRRSKREASGKAEAKSSERAAAVPDEPTREIWAAMGDAYGKVHRDNGRQPTLHHDVVTEAIYHAIRKTIAASPQPPVGEG